jgi:hypothetical protein
VPFDVLIQVPQIIQPRRVLVVLHDGQFSALREPSQLAGTHSQIESGFFGPQQAFRDVCLYSHSVTQAWAQSSHSLFWRFVNY